MFLIGTYNEDNADIVYAVLTITFAILQWK